LSFQYVYLVVLSAIHLLYLGTLAPYCAPQANINLLPAIPYHPGEQGDPLHAEAPAAIKGTLALRLGCESCLRLTALYAPKALHWHAEFSTNKLSLASHHDSCPAPLTTHPYPEILPPFTILALWLEW
jgi:hypothetical protein